MRSELARVPAARARHRDNARHEPWRTKRPPASQSLGFCLSRRRDRPSQAQSSPVKPFDAPWLTPGLHCVTPACPMYNIYNKERHGNDGGEKGALFCRKSRGRGPVSRQKGCVQTDKRVQTALSVQTKYIVVALFLWLCVVISTLRQL